MASLYEYYNANDDDIYSLFAAGWRGQTFTVGTVGTNEAHILASIKVQGNKVGSPGTITFDIKATSGGLPTGEIISTGSYNGNSFPAYPSRGWSAAISMSPCVFLPNTKYAIIASVPSGNSSNYFGWGHDRSSPTYAGGCCILSSNSGVDWSENTDVDQMFEVWGNPVILPSTLTLALTQHAPSLVIDSTASPPTQELALTQHAPTIVVNCTVTPPTFALALTQHVPSLFVGNIVTPDAFELALTQHSPGLAFDYTIFPSTLELVLTQNIPIVSFDIIVFPAVFELEAAFHAPETISRYTAIPPFMQKDLIDPYSGGAWLWLCEIAVPGYTTQNIVRNTVDVRHAGKDYNKWNLDLSKQIFAGDGSIHRVTLRIAQDPARTFEKIVNASKGCHDGTVKLIRVNEKFLDYRVTALEADYDILVADSDWEWVYFTLGIPNLLTQRIPLRVGSSKICPWAVPEYFKGVRCRYTGSDVSCTGKLSDCYAKGNAQHWGGEVGLDPNVTRV